jgi:hypothetical protein
MDNINRINHYNGAGYFGLEETDDEIVKLINGLNEEQLAKLSSINMLFPLHIFSFLPSHFHPQLTPPSPFLGSNQYKDMV